MFCIWESFTVEYVYFCNAFNKKFNYLFKILRIHFTFCFKFSHIPKCLFNNQTLVVYMINNPPRYVWHQNHMCMHLLSIPDSIQNFFKKWTTCYYVIRNGHLSFYTKSVKFVGRNHVSTRVPVPKVFIEHFPSWSCRTF